MTARYTAAEVRAVAKQCRAEQEIGCWQMLCSYADLLENPAGRFADRYRGLMQMLGELVQDAELEAREQGRQEVLREVVEILGAPEAAVEHAKDGSPVTDTGQCVFCSEFIFQMSEDDESLRMRPHLSECFWLRAQQARAQEAT